MREPTKARKRLGNLVLLIIACLWLGTLYRANQAQKRHELELAAQTDTQQALYALMNSTSLAYAILDETGKFVFYNPGMERLFVYTPEEMTGKNLSQLMAPDQFAEHQARFNERIQRIKQSKGKARRELLEEVVPLFCEGLPKGKPPETFRVAIRAVVNPIDGKIFIHAFAMRPDTVVPAGAPPA